MADTQPVAEEAGVVHVDVIATPKRRLIMGVDLGDVPWKIYISRGLSAWGDRMWSYGSGLFMTS